MKKILTIILISILSIFTVNADMTNGSFYADNNVECHLIAPSGAIKTNALIAGRTYPVGDLLTELAVSNATTFYFSDGTVMGASTNSAFSINLFDEEVKNFDGEPQWVDVGTVNLSLTFTRGQFCVIYPNKDASSSFSAMTPFSGYEFQTGKYLIRVSDKSSVVYVAEGQMKIDDANKTGKSSKGNIAIAMPYNDPVSGVADKIITSVKPLQSTETDNFTSPFISLSSKTNAVKFAIINGKIIGIKN